jgi:hypothetical protein
MTLTIQAMPKQGDQVEVLQTNLQLAAIPLEVPPAPATAFSFQLFSWRSFRQLSSSPSAHLVIRLARGLPLRAIFSLFSPIMSACYRCNTFCGPIHSESKNRETKKSKRHENLFAETSFASKNSLPPAARAASTGAAMTAIATVSGLWRCASAPPASSPPSALCQVENFQPLSGYFRLFQAISGYFSLARPSLPLPSDLSSEARREGGRERSAR